MYNYVPMICGCVLIVLSLYCISNPKAATKKEFREDAEKVKKTRKSGFALAGLGAVLIITSIVMFIIEK